MYNYDSFKKLKFEFVLIKTPDPAWDLKQHGPLKPILDIKIHEVLKQNKF